VDSASVVPELITLQYQEMFALCQSLPGPGSTKMLYVINVIRSGFVVGLLSFLVWR
jgi:chromate transport protein ChrA